MVRRRSRKPKITGSNPVRALAGSRRQEHSRSFLGEGGEPRGSALPGGASQDGRTDRGDPPGSGTLRGGPNGSGPGRAPGNGRGSAARLQRNVSGGGGLERTEHE